MAAQLCWCLEEDLAHGDSSELDVSGEKNLKTFDVGDQLAICAEVKIEQKLSTIYTYASYTRSRLDNMINILKIVCKDVLPSLVSSRAFLAFRWSHFRLHATTERVRCAKDK